MKSQLSLHERIRNANASQEVEKVKARHTYLHGRADATGEWADIWSRDPNCSWAHIFGRMRGFDQIWHRTDGNLSGNGRKGSASFDGSIGAYTCHGYYRSGRGWHERQRLLYHTGCHPFNTDAR